MHNELKIAAAYIRVSTDDQAEYSPDAQLFELRKYASKEGYIIPSEYIFIDEGISGKKADKRPEFQRMIATAKSDTHPFDSILLWKFSRFARNQEESIVYKSMLKKDKVDVVSITEPLIEGPFGSLIERIIEWMDEYYSIRLSGEVKKGMTEKARRGELQTIASFGYKLNNGKIVPEPEEAKIIKEIFDRFIAGMGLFPIAKWLNDIGVKTHRGNKFENRTIEYILRNPVYIGKLRWNPSGRTRRDFNNENIITMESTHEPLIDAETWDKAQKRMAEVKARWRYKSHPVTELKEWTSGIVRCADCEGTLVFQQPHFYKCNNYVRGSCKSTQHVKVDLIKEAVMKCMELDYQSHTPLEHVIKCMSKSGNDETERLNQYLDSLNKKMLRLREAFYNGADTVDEYRSYKDEINVEIEKIKQRLHSINDEAQQKFSMDNLKNAISEALRVLKSPDASKEEKHEAANEIIETCTYSKAENRLKIVYRSIFIE